MAANQAGTLTSLRSLLVAASIGSATMPLCAADIAVGNINGVTAWGAADGVAAYSFGTVICNLGETPLAWVASSSEHPAIVHGVYRLRNGRLEMIGMSWVAHGFCALQQSFCGECSPVGPGCQPALGAGCADIVGASIAGQQAALSPRSQVDPVDASFAFPFSGPAIEPVVGRRVQIAADDLDPSHNAGAVYFVEAIALHAQDAAAGSSANNLTHRPLVIGGPVGGVWSLTFGGPPVQQSALHGWASLDPGVRLAAIDVEGDGRFLVASRVVQLGPALWDYEYAVMNVNSRRALGAFAIAGSRSAAVSEIAFRGIPHHSGEPYASDPWSISSRDGAVTWATAAFDDDPNANALRWGTLFNFRFVADTPPTDGLATLGLFAPGDAADPTVTVLVPSSGPCAPADLNCDGVVDGADLGILLNAWGPCAGCPADLDGNGVIDGADLGILLQAWR